MAVDAEGSLWAFWSEREGTRWHIRGRQRRDGQWQRVITVAAKGPIRFIAPPVPPTARYSSCGRVFTVRRAGRRATSWRGSTPAGRGPTKCTSANRRRTIGSQRSPPARTARPTSPGTATTRATTTSIFARLQKRRAGAPVHVVTTSHRLSGHASIAVRLAGPPLGGLERSRRQLGQGPGLPDPQIDGDPAPSTALACGSPSWNGGRGWSPPSPLAPPFRDSMRDQNDRASLDRLRRQRPPGVLFRHRTSPATIARIGSPHRRLGDLPHALRRRPLDHTGAAADSAGSIEEMRPALARADDGNSRPPG